MTTVLEASDLVHQVRLADGRRLELLRGVDLTIARGETVAIQGRSGSGKSTLLALLGLLAPLAHGRLTIAGVCVERLSDARRARIRNQHIGFVFQAYSLVAHLNAEQNVALPLRYWQRRPADRSAASRLLEAVGLADRRRARPRHLSGGEQQRVAIARALARAPDLILADEPTGALDIDTAGEVLDTLIGVASRQGCGLVVVTHDPDVAARMDRCLRLEAGSLHPS